MIKPYLLLTSLVSARSAICSPILNRLVTIILMFSLSVITCSNKSECLNLLNQVNSLCHVMNQKQILLLKSHKQMPIYRWYYEILTTFILHFKPNYLTSPFYIYGLHVFFFQCISAKNAHFEKFVDFSWITLHSTSYKNF